MTKDEDKTKEQLISELEEVRQRIAEMEMSEIEQRPAAQALKENEERFQTSVENMLDCFGIYSAIRDESGRIIDFLIEYVNAAACTNNLMTREEQIGKRLCELLPAHRETGLFEEYCHVVEKGNPLTKESLFYEDTYKEQCLTRAFDIRAAKLGDGFAVAWRDITERKMMEQELLKYRDYLEAQVQDRTVKLQKANKQLRRELTEHKRAEAKLLTYQEQLRVLASQLSLAEERERRHIATQIHDHLGQNLAFCSIQLGQLMKSASSAGLAKALGEIHSVIKSIIEETRSLNFDLSSPLLYEVGLGAAVEKLTEQTQERYGIKSTFEDDGQPQPADSDIDILLFQAVRELLVNVAKHAQAHNVRVCLKRHGRETRVIIEDDGVGFDTARIDSNWKAADGIGLFSIRERLSAVGGYLHIESEPGHGTCATVVGPLKYE